MYKRRLYTFIFICAIPVALCMVRLAYLQFALKDEFREAIEKKRIFDTMQLPTVRGSIIDRDGNALAIDAPVFNLYINYSLTRLMDDRYWKSRIVSRTNEKTTPEQAKAKMEEELTDSIAALETTLEVCSKFEDGNRKILEERIQRINNRIWNWKKLFAWLWYCPESPTKVRYKTDPNYIGAMKDFKNQHPEEDERLKLIAKVDLTDMHKSYRLMELRPDSELYEAQRQLNSIMELNGRKVVEIVPEAKRRYPYGSAAAQLIGWVGPAQDSDKALFANDDYSRYLTDEVSGRSGVEKVCEVMLRGRRGEVTIDFTGKRLDHKETEFGTDVRLSIDIKLQRQIESMLSDPNHNPNAFAGIGAVVIDVARGDVLAMVSVPTYDLNTVRQNYNELLNAKKRPLWNKAMAEHYPPGSTIKPILLAVALEEKKTWIGEEISCPSEKAPQGWPNCPIYLKSHVGHDYRQNEGISNTGRNAIRYSCNVYFSHLANRLDPKVFQRRFFSFGYGHKILPGPFGTRQSLPELEKGMDRFLPEATGYVSSKISRGIITGPDDLPRLRKTDLKQFGVGQGNFTATVLQVANAAAVIARGGIYMDPRLFLDDSESFEDNQVDLGLSPNTLATVRDGMRAVITETHGTGHVAFASSNLDSRDVKVFGKSGSTQGNRNAWFMCFAEDKAGRAISVALVVEGGESGSEDAAPLVRRILELCNESGYIGRKPQR